MMSKDRLFFIICIYWRWSSLPPLSSLIPFRSFVINVSHSHCVKMTQIKTNNTMQHFSANTKYRNNGMISRKQLKSSAEAAVILQQVREGVKKKTFFLGRCPKHRTPPTHHRPYFRTKSWKKRVFSEWLFSLESLGLCPKHRTPPTHHARLGLH